MERWLKIYANRLAPYYADRSTVPQIIAQVRGANEREFPTCLEPGNITLLTSLLPDWPNPVGAIGLAQIMEATTFCSESDKIGIG